MENLLPLNIWGLTDRMMDLGASLPRTVVKYDNYLYPPKCPCRIHLAKGRQECYDMPPGYNLDENGYCLPPNEILPFSSVWWWNDASWAPCWTFQLMAEYEYAIEIGVN